MHSRHPGRLCDLPVSRRKLELRLTARRFFCVDTGRAKATLTEQVERLTTTWARRIPGLSTALEPVGLALAGRAGSRLVERLGLRDGRSSLLRLVRTLPEPEVGTVPLLRVDDFAFRRMIL